ncbi:TolC family protein [Ruegeria sp.]|uniref:TolC family protein n=1 Tax=Ruegeria sp. TaxID=1879320 RepID=UPI003B00BD5C
MNAKHFKSPRSQNKFLKILPCSRCKIDNSHILNRQKIFSRKEIKALLLIFISVTASCTSGQLENPNELSAATTPIRNANKTKISDLEIKLPFLRENTLVEKLAYSAIVTNDRLSPRIDLVSQRRLESIATVRNRWPQVAPIANYDNEGKLNVGVGATYTMYDFGRSKAQQAQAERLIEMAQLELLEDRTRSVSDVLKSLIDASESNELLSHTSASVHYISELRILAEKRVVLGVVDKSEQNLFDLRLAELRDQVNSDKSALQSALGSIMSKTEKELTSKSVPTLNAIRLSFKEKVKYGRSPDLIRAQLELDIAEHQFELVGARRYPTLLLRGSLLSDGYTVSPSATIALETSDFPGLAVRPVFLAARSAVSSARSNIAYIERSNQIELQQISLERARLETRVQSLNVLVNEAQHAVELFEQQQTAGRRSLTDGITVYRTLLESSRDIVIVRSELLRLRLQEAVLLGTLVFEEVNQ